MWTIEIGTDMETSITKKIGVIEITLVNDNIAERRVDAIVNAANNMLQMGGGVAAALRSAGGIEIHKEAIKQAPAPIGSIIKTGAGKLNAKNIYHAVVIDYDVNKGTSPSAVITVIQNLIPQAEADKIQNMAMPLFRAGVGGLGPAQSVRLILETIEDELKEVSAPLKIEIVVRDANEFKTAKESFEDYKGRKEEAKEANQLADEFMDELLKKK